LDHERHERARKGWSAKGIGIEEAACGPVSDKDAAEVAARRLGDEQGRK
jgi:hypothetical protein